jgi:thiol:disulfide interchange protein DsbD
MKTAKKVNNESQISRLSGLVAAVKYLTWLVCFCGCLAGAAARAAHTQVQLRLSDIVARAGDTVWAGVDLKMDRGWHIYWRNPGDTGIATDIKWHLPAGVTAGDIQWPLPHKLELADVTTYTYDDEVMLLVPLTLASNLNAVPLKLCADVSWLECQDQCVPAKAMVEATVNIGKVVNATVDAATIESWESKVPRPGNQSLLAWWNNPGSNDTRTLNIGTEPISSVESAHYDSLDFFPEANDNYEVQPATIVSVKRPAGISLSKTVQKFAGDWPKVISGVIVAQQGSWQSAFEVSLPVADQAPSIQPSATPAVTPIPAIAAGASLSSASAVTNPPSRPLWQMLIYAFVGGLILNIMPCVLPVIALKILGFVNEARSEARHVRMLGFVYALGVLVSFLILAALIIGVKAAGHQAGWGMQFGSPVFIVCLCTLVTLVALNLFGVFEVILGGSAMNRAGELAKRSGASGAFFNGVLATTLATPCTAPFLAPALGFAFAQSAQIVILIFMFIGLGLASPYVLLSWNPGWLKLLPKPGAWMEKFKIGMGFPMLATVMWLLYIASSSYGKDVAWLGGFLVVVAMAAWIFGEFVQRGRRNPMAATLVALLLLGAGYFLILERELNWRGPHENLASDGTQPFSPDGINWKPWSADAIRQARAAGRPVVVDFTAGWCLTCQVNKKTSLEIPSVCKKLKDLDAVTLRGDYTRFPDRITEELQRFGRAGVPLVLVYPKSASASPIALPEILTPSIVLAALNSAGK